MCHEKNEEIEIWWDASIIWDTVRARPQIFVEALQCVDIKHRCKQNGDSANKLC
jgi:hypothetical protein